MQGASEGSSGLQVWGKPGSFLLTVIPFGLRTWLRKSLSVIAVLGQPLEGAASVTRDPCPHYPDVPPKDGHESIYLIPTTGESLVRIGFWLFTVLLVLFLS